MLLTRNSGTVPASSESIAKLNAAARVSTFDEAGWAIAVGYDAHDNRLVAVHFHSRESRDSALGRGPKFSRDEAYANFERNNLLAMQARQQEAMGRCN